jgi:hypothetical protein
MLSEPTNWPRAKNSRLIVLLAGVVFCQFFLYGPSLVGQKVLLPLDILAQPGIYLPRTVEIARIEPKNLYVSDLVLLFEPMRQFAVSEWHAGRLPVWLPYEFAGAPCAWPKFSPFLMLECCAKSPVVLAWAQLVAAIVAAVGAYLFFRRALGLNFWPAVLCAWCYPLTGFFIFWQGFPTALPVYWLPWVLLAVDRTARGTSAAAPIGLSVATCLALISGHLDVAGQVLLASGLYGLGRFLQIHRKLWLQRQARRAAAGLLAGWALGVLLAAPYLLPVLEYTLTGARMAQRAGGLEERPPVGLKALPQIVLPDLYGSMATGSYRGAREHQAESSAVAYAGVLATLLIAPLSFCSRRHRAFNVLLVLLSVLAVGWCLNVPGLVNLLRAPGLNLMSHNRLVFVASFAILALAAIGLEVLWQGGFSWRWWMWLPLGVLAGLCLWCAWRAADLPEPVRTRIEATVLRGNTVGWIKDLEGVRRAQTWLVHAYAAAAFWCGLGALGWLVLRRGQAALLPVFGGLMLADLLWFAHGRAVQSDPALYYPPVRTLEALAKAAPGRVMGYGCLPATLSAMCGLRDVRGYDGVDPARMVDLLLAAAVPASFKAPYAATMYLAPRATVTRQGEMRLSPILDMLGVRYVIFRGEPPPHTYPRFQEPDCSVVENLAAMPRAFVPRRVEVMAEGAARLERLASARFDPRELACVESPVTLPTSCRGTVELLDELPARIKLAVRMETPGLVVLADLWDQGWRAWLNGRPVPILRTNHALRGVVVPAGDGTLEFRYEPASFAWGLRLAGLAAVALLAGAWGSFRRATPGPSSRRLLQGRRLVTAGRGGRLALRAWRCIGWPWHCGGPNAGRFGIGRGPR